MNFILQRGNGLIIERDVYVDYRRIGQLRGTVSIADTSTVDVSILTRQEDGSDLYESAHYTAKRGNSNIISDIIKDFDVIYEESVYGAIKDTRTSITLEDKFLDDAGNVYLLCEDFMIKNSPTITWSFPIEDLSYWVTNMNCGNLYIRLSGFNEVIKLALVTSVSSSFQLYGNNGISNKNKIVGNAHFRVKDEECNYQFKLNSLISRSDNIFVQKYASVHSINEWLLESINSYVKNPVNCLLRRISFNSEIYHGEERIGTFNEEYSNSKNGNTRLFEINLKRMDELDVYKIKLGEELEISVGLS